MIKNYWIVPCLLNRRITIDDMFEIFLKATKISRKEFTPKGGKGDLPLFRHILICMFRNHMHLNLKDIGGMLNRDHTTIICSIRMANKLYQSNLDFKDKFDFFDNYIKTQFLPIPPPLKRRNEEIRRREENGLNPPKVIKIVKPVKEPKIIKVIEPEPVKFERPKAVYSNTNYSLY